jgi:hypothetical protein
MARPPVAGEQVGVQVPRMRRELGLQEALRMEHGVEPLLFLRQRRT